MRLFHISDLHIGKRLNDTDLTEDLRYVLFEQVLGSAYERFRPDALIVSGDIYDKAAPAADGVAMFDEFLSKAAELDLPVYAISGNHDNAQRVGYGRKLFAASSIYISEPFSAESPVTVVECGNIDIALLPYFSAETAAQMFPEDGIEEMKTALQAVFRRGGIPREGRPCVLAAHLSVGGKGAGAVGSLEMVDHNIFQPFAYTALGHFHDPHNVGGPRVRYCGSPVCFSLKEARNPQKYIDVIDIDDNGEVEVTNHPIIPLHEVRLLEGTFESLISDDVPETEDYAFITVNGDSSEADIAQRLKLKFPNCVSIRYEEERAANEELKHDSEMSFDELFGGFFRLAMGEDIEPELLKIAKEIYDEAKGGAAE